MANSIALAKSYVPLLDETYKLASLTSDLDGADESGHRPEMCVFSAVGGKNL